MIRLGGVGLAFLDQRARHVQPAVGVAGFGLGDLLERVLGALQIALQQQADAPIVPALAILLCAPPASMRAGPSGSVALRLRQRNDRQVGNAVRESCPRRSPGCCAAWKLYSRLL